MPLNFAGKLQWLAHHFWALGTKRKTFNRVAHCARGLKVQLRKDTPEAPDIISSLIREHAFEFK